MNNKKSRGASPVEFMVVVLISAGLLTLAVPAFSDMLDTMRLKSASARLHMTMSLAKSEAIKRNKPIRLTFQRSGNGVRWCYGLAINRACNCWMANSCTLDGRELLVSHDDYPGVRLEPRISSPGDRLTFEPTGWMLNGTFGHVRLHSAAGRQVRVIATRSGRIRTCSPDGPHHVSGYAASC